MTQANFLAEQTGFENPEDRYSRDEAHMWKILLFNLPS